MKKDRSVFLYDIIESIELIETYIAGKEEKDFIKSIGMQDQVIRRLEIIGEAVKSLPKEWKDKTDYTEWKQIAGMRDFLIHQYFRIDCKIVWNTVKRDIPLLKKAVLEIKKNIEADE
jgi:uncharacterized protein with HEPN domain